MNGEVIKSFLVSLGFGVDESSLAKFNKAITSATVRVTALYAAIQVAASGIFYGISKISESFEDMGREMRLIAPAINKALQLRQALLSAYAAAGINLTKAAQESVKFNFSLAKTKFILDAIYKSVGLKFIPLLTKQMDMFRARIYANLPKIQSVLEKVVKFIFSAFEATVRLGERVWSILGRVFEFFKKLDEATGGWSTKILAAVAAWKLLNLSFLASPLGLLIAGIVGILALFDDFKTWQEGGESLFDWSKFLPVINAVAAAFQSWVEVLMAVIDAVKTLFDAFNKLFHADFSGFFSSLKDYGEKALGVFGKLYDHIKNMFGILGSVGGFISNMVTGNNPYTNPTNFATPPIGAASALNNNVNQSLNQQTSITVQGSPDANSTAKNIANEQRNVNFDLVRNMGSPTQ